jgi:hypothetical protein
MNIYLNRFYSRLPSGRQVHPRSFTVPAIILHIERDTAREAVKYQPEMDGDERE